MASIRLDGVTKRFGACTAVDGLGVEIADGEFFVILGPTGAGKSTTLRLVAGLEAPDAGAVYMDGIDVTRWHPAERDVAFVFQQYSLYPHLSVYDNIAFPLRAPRRRVAEQDIRARVERVAEMLHIGSKLDRRSATLSGGEMQRVAIGRALVRRPKVFLMDEPLSSLDAKMREELRVELRRVQRELNATVIYVTHDQVEATTLADRLAVLEAGRLKQVGTPERVYEDPESLSVAQRLGSPPVNVLPAEWMNGSAPREARFVAIRPEDVRVLNRAEAGYLEAIGFSVVECSLLKHVLVAERDEIEVRVTAVMEHARAAGEEVRFAFPVERRLHFDADGQRLRR